jgi:hypothetical protein
MVYSNKGALQRNQVRKGKGEGTAHENETKNTF